MKGKASPCLPGNIYPVKAGNDGERESYVYREKCTGSGNLGLTSLSLSFFLCHGNNLVPSAS